MANRRHIINRLIIRKASIFNVTEQERLRETNTYIWKNLI